MLSLFSKARIVGLGDLHDIADRAIDMNSPGAVRQMIRDLDSVEGQINEALAQNAAERAGLERDLNSLHTQEAQANADAEALVKAGKDDSAQKVLAKLDPLESQIKAHEQQQQTAAQARTNLQQALSAVQGKRQVMQTRLSELESTNAQAKGLEAAAGAMTLAQNATSSVDGANIDDMASRAQHRLDVAQAHFDQASGSVQDSVGDDLASARAADRLAALKARMAQPATAG